MDQPTQAQVRAIDNAAAAPAGSPTPSPVVDVNPANLRQAQALTPSSGYKQDEVAAHLNDPDWVQTAKATWNVETLTGQALRTMGIDSSIPETGNPMDSFDPFGYYAKNKARYGHVLNAMVDGAFDNVRSEAEFQRRAQLITLNQQDREAIAQGQGGSMIANMGASLLDLPTILSFGSLGVGLKATSLAARVASGATVGFMDAAAQEAALHGLDPTRTSEEALLNIGFNTFVGAGLGSLFKHLPPDHPIRPGHEQNPWREGAEIPPTIEQQVGHMPPTVDARDPDAHVGGSVGAAAARTGDDRIATGNGWVSRIIDKALSAPTPIGRMNGYLGSGQSAISQLFDLGGLTLEKNLRGQAHAPEAEAYLTMYKHSGQAVIRDFEQSYRELSIDLHGSASHKAGAALDMVSLGAKDTRTLDRSTYFDLIDEDLSAKMTNNVKVGQESRARLKDLGLADDQVEKVMAAVRKDSERFTGMTDDMMDEAIRIGLAKPEDKKANYGKPIIYVKTAIDANQGAMRALAMRKFSEAPHQDFLVEHGYVKDPNAKPIAGEEKVAGPEHADWKAIVESGDMKLQNDILTHYRGRQEDHALEEATQRVAGLQQQQLKANREFEAISDGLDAAKADLKDANLKKMKARTREVEANWYGRKLGSKQAEINAADETIKRIDEKWGTNGDQAGPSMEQAHAQATAQAQKAGTDISGLTDFLQDAKGAKDAATIREKTAVIGQRTAKDEAEFAAAMAERQAAMTQRRNAAEELEGLMGQLRDASKRHRESQAMIDQVVKDSHAHAEGLKTSEQRAGVESVLAGQKERIDALKVAYADAERAWKEAGDVYRGNRAGLRVSRSELAQTSKELRRAVFAKKRVEGATPLSQYVDKWVDSMRGADRRPGGMLLDRDPMTGRLQERKIEWSTQDMKDLKRLGFIETDVAHMTERYSQDMGAEIALHKSFEGKRKEDVLRDMNSDYQAAIDKATDPKEIAALNTARKKNEADIDAGFDRIRGMHDMKDNNGLTWFADKIGKLGLLRYMGGFVFGAMGDVATSAMAVRGAAGSFAKHVATMGAETRYILKKAAEGDPGMRELSKILGSFENAAHMAVSDRALGNGSARDVIGVGSGMTRQITGKVDKYLGLAADKLNALSGLKGFSDAVRRNAGLVQLANLSEWVGKGWGNLSKGQQADLLALGIGERESGKLAKLFKDHATVHENGLVSPNMYKWLTAPDGNEMSDLLTVALEKAQKRASYTSGMGHMPLLMDKWYGKLFMQFQSYGLQFYSNFMRTGAQRIALNPGDAKAYQAFALALAGGVVTTEIAEFRAKGRDENHQAMDRTGRQYMYSILQRSGALGYLGSYADAGVLLGAPSLRGGASKFSQNDWLTNLMGPGMGTLKVIGTAGADAARGEFSDAGKQIKTFVPLRQQAEFFNGVFSK